MIAFLACKKGDPVNKRGLAEILWPDADSAHAMDNLYKAYGYIKKLKNEGVIIPIQSSKNVFCLNLTEVSCDLVDFERMCSNESDYEDNSAAVELYQGPVLEDECYDWIATYEAYYELRYMELLDHLIAVCHGRGNMIRKKYYQNKLNSLVGL